MWKWRHEANGIYTTKAAYKRRTGSEQQQGERNQESKAFKSLWRCFAPNRVKAIVWKALRGRLPTKMELQKRGVHMANNDTTCVLCGEDEEQMSHLLFTCKVSWELWTLCYRWVKVDMVPHNNPIIHLLQHRRLLGGKGDTKIASTIWTALIWAIWSGRNDQVFNGKKFDMHNIFREVRARVWSWLVAKEKTISNLSFKDWCNNPVVSR